MQVAQQIAGRVAHLAVNVGQLFDDARTQGHIGGVIDGTHPEAQHIGALLQGGAAEPVFVSKEFSYWREER